MSNTSSYKMNGEPTFFFNLGVPGVTIVQIEKNLLSHILYMYTFVHIYVIRDRTFKICAPYSNISIHLIAKHYFEELIVVVSRVCTHAKYFVFVVQ